IRFFEDRLCHIFSDFASVYVECRHYFDVTRPVAANLPMHEADGGIGLQVAIKVDPLNQRTGTVSHAHDCDPDFFHHKLSIGASFLEFTFCEGFLKRGFFFGLSSRPPGSTGPSIRSTSRPLTRRFSSAGPPRLWSSVCLSRGPWSRRNSRSRYRNRTNP